MVRAKAIDMVMQLHYHSRSLNSGENQHAFND